MLVGRLAGARPARQRGDGSGRTTARPGTGCSARSTPADDVTDKEQAFIEALSARYAENPPEDRRPLDEAYAEAMGKLAAEFPDDLDAVTLHAESLMDLQPWDYWDADGKAKGHTAEVLSQLESVMARNPDHAGALHLYVHAVEASPEPEKGVAAADRLRTLWPGSGHLVHMPAHIYARVGRYHDAVIANQKAIGADDAYLAICKPGPGVYPLGYVPHNHHFLWFAATHGGRERDRDRSRGGDTIERTSDPELMRTPGFGAMQDFALTPMFADLRFGRWDHDQGDAEAAPTTCRTCRRCGTTRRPSPPCARAGWTRRRRITPTSRRRLPTRRSRRCWPGTAIR